MTAIVKTICEMCGDAYATCGLDVYVENGKIVKIKGMKEHPTNRGTLCPKGIAAIQLQNDPRRLQYPLKRVGERGAGKWKRISWDEALDTIATKLTDLKQQYGPETLHFHRGQGAGWESPFEYTHRFLAAYGSPNFGTHSHLCDAPRSIGHTYTYGFNKPLPDWDNTRCMVLWGYNPMETSLANHGARIIEAKERGVPLIVIDPRFTRTASKADIWVQPRPGTDGALALAIANVIISEGLQDSEFIEKWTTGYDKFVELVQQHPPERVEEITWVPADTIRQVARIYATTKPAALWDCNGLDQHTNVVQTTRAICILRVITGNIDAKGGNVWDPEGFGFRKTRIMNPRPYEDMELIEKMFSRSIAKYFVFFKSHGCRTVDAIRSLETDKPYRIRAMIVEAGDPLTSLSNHRRTREAFMKLEFLVVHDIFMTHSAEIADIVLPAATFLERTSLVKYLFEGKPRVDTNFLSLRDKAVEPLGECKSDVDFLCQLARRMGYEEYFPWSNIEECINYELEPVGLTVEDLRREKIVTRKYDPERLYGKYEVFCAKLPTKKIELYSKAFEQMGHDPLPTYHEPAESPISRPDLAKDFPMVCQATIKPGLFTHAMFRTLPWLRDIAPEPWVEINTEKAKELGISDRDMVMVESPRASIKVKAKLTEGIDPRLVSVTHGWGQAYAHGAIDNLITPDEGECPVCGATGNRSFLCRISKAAGG
jgi:anaerobic selenocysteine-containing dehydrogenase